MMKEGKTLPELDDLTTARPITDFSKLSKAQVDYLGIYFFCFLPHVSIEWKNVLKKARKKDQIVKYESFVRRVNPSDEGYLLLVVDHYHHTWIESVNELLKISDDLAEGAPQAERGDSAKWFAAARRHRRDQRRQEPAKGRGPKERLNKMAGRRDDYNDFYDMVEGWDEAAKKPGIDYKDTFEKIQMQFFNIEPVVGRMTDPKDETAQEKRRVKKTRVRIARSRV